MKRFRTLALLAAIALAGCAYKGGKVVDGSNIEIGMTIPGTEWSINFLSATSGLKVGANEGCALSVTNEVCETNKYFGVVEMTRYTKMSAKVEPCEMEETKE